MAYATEKVGIRPHVPTAEEWHASVKAQGVEDAKSGNAFAPEFWFGDVDERAEYTAAFLEVQPNNEIAQDWMKKYLRRQERVVELTGAPPCLADWTRWHRGGQIPDIQ